MERSHEKHGTLSQGSEALSVLSVTRRMILSSLYATVTLSLLYATSLTPSEPVSPIELGAGALVSIASNL